jgi:hypothetical protein
MRRRLGCLDVKPIKIPDASGFGRCPVFEIFLSPSGKCQNCTFELAETTSTHAFSN